MKAQTIITLPLILCLALGPAARPSVAQEEERGDATKITAEEEQEVREVAERFVRRMQETNDLTPLIGEMFVSDYGERLRQEAMRKSLLLMRKSVAEQASREDLARYQLALNNCGYLVGLLVSDDEEENEEKLISALPPDLLNLFKNDPILTSLYEAEASGQTGEDKTSEPVKKIDLDDGVPAPIESVEQLRNFTSTLEQASILARKHLAALPVKSSHLQRHKGANEEENWEAERDWMRPRAWVLTREFFGYPEGTRIFCANVLLYHMDIIRVGGELKVLALYPNMD